MSENPLSSLSEEEQQVLVDIAKQNEEPRVGRRDVLKAGGVLGIGGLIGAGAGYSAVDPVKADAQGNLGTASDPWENGYIDTLEGSVIDYDTYLQNGEPFESGLQAGENFDGEGTSEFTNLAAVSTGELSNTLFFASEDGLSPSEALDAADGSQGTVVIDDGMTLESDARVPEGVTLTSRGVVYTDEYQIIVNQTGVKIDGLTVEAPSDKSVSTPLAIGIGLADGETIGSVTLSDINIAAHGNADSCVRVQNTDIVRFRDGDLRGSEEQALIDVEGCADVLIEGLKLRDAGREAIDIYQDNGEVTIRKCDFSEWLRRRSTPDGAISSYGPNNQKMLVEDCKFDTGNVSYDGDGAKAIRSNGCKDVTVRDCEITMQSTDNHRAIHVSQRDGFEPDNVQICNNDIEVTEDIERVINCADADSLTISDNNITSNSTADSVIRPINTTKVKLHGNYYSLSGSSITEAFINSGGIKEDIVVEGDIIDTCPGDFVKARGSAEPPRVKLLGLTVEDATGEMVTPHSASGAFGQTTITGCSFVTTADSAVVVDSDAFSSLTIADSYLESATDPIDDSNSSDVDMQIDNNHEITT